MYRPHVLMVWCEKGPRLCSDFIPQPKQPYWISILVKALLTFILYCSRTHEGWKAGRYTRYRCAVQFQHLFHVWLYTPTLQPLNHEKCPVQVGAKASVSECILYQPPAQRGAYRHSCFHLLPSPTCWWCARASHIQLGWAHCPGFVSSPRSSPQCSILWLNILFCKIRFSVPDSCGKQPSSAPLCFITVALFLTDFNHPIIRSDTALTPYHCNLINFWSHKSFLYIMYVVSMLNLLFAPQGHSAASVMCKCSREGEQSSSWRGHRGAVSLPSCKA